VQASLKIELLQWKRDRSDGKKSV